MKHIQLNSGYQIPVLGLGTYQGDDNVAKAREAVKIAIDLGYRLFDCAYAYSNEEDVGAAIEEKIKEGKVKREDVFVVTKLWNTHHNPRHVESAIRNSLKKLKLDYLDLYLIHWPTAFVIECHPYLTQEKLRKFCADKHITMMAYSPLGSRHRPWAKPGEPDILSDDKLVAIAKKYNKTPGQILLRFQVQLGNVAIPKSSNPDRLKENIDIFNFELNKADMDYICSFNMGTWRICSLAVAKKHPEYPFHIEF